MCIYIHIYIYICTYVYVFISITVIMTILYYNNMCYKIKSYMIYDIVLLLGYTILRCEGPGRARTAPRSPAPGAAPRSWRPPCGAPRG